MHGCSQSDISVLSLGENSKYAEIGVASVLMVGSNKKIQWKQEEVRCYLYCKFR
jgi:hypothetical protein